MMMLLGGLIHRCVDAVDASIAQCELSLMLGPPLPFLVHSLPASSDFDLRFN